MKRQVALIVSMLAISAVGASAADMPSPTSPTHTVSVGVAYKFGGPVVAKY